MARYLVVAHQTAESGELLEHLHKRARDEPGAEFVLLVPATSIDHLLAWAEGETDEIAARRGESAAGMMRDVGINVTEVVVGDPSPVAAVEDELRRRPGYDAIIISTMRPGASRWLGLDVVSRLRGRVAQKVTHVIAERLPTRV